MNYEIKTSIKNIDFYQVNDILNGYGLSNFDVDTQKKVFENSFAVVFLLLENQIIGLGRAISDGVCQAAIYNVAIRNEYRGKGLGKVVIENLLCQVQGCNVILYTHPRYLGLYEHWGFSKMKTGYAIYKDQEYYRREGFII